MYKKCTDKVTLSWILMYLLDPTRKSPIPEMGYSF